MKQNFKYTCSGLLLMAYTLDKLANGREEILYNGFWDDSNLQDAMQPVFISKFIVEDLCKKYGAIKHVEVEIYDKEGSGIPDEIKTFTYRSQTKKEDVFDDLIFNMPLGLGFGIPRTGKAWAVNYKIKFDLDRLKQFIIDYLYAWEQGDLSSSTGNILKAEKQIEKVTQDISKLLSNYSSKNLKFKAKWNRYSETDVIGTMIYFERMGAIEILEIGLEDDSKVDLMEDKTYASWTFRINVTDKFTETTNTDFSKNASQKATFKLGFDPDKLEVFILGERNRFWPIKHKNGELKHNGRVAKEMFEKRGQACCEDRDNVRSFVRSSSKALNISPNEIEKNLLIKGNLYGLK